MLICFLFLLLVRRWSGGKQSREAKSDATADFPSSALLCFFFSFPTGVVDDDEDDDDDSDMESSDDD